MASRREEGTVSSFFQNPSREERSIRLLQAVRERRRRINSDKRTSTPNTFPTSSNDSCAICLNPLGKGPHEDEDGGREESTVSEGEGVHIMKPKECEHGFCQECILEWSKTARTCPLCKTHFGNELLRYVIDFQTEGKTLWKLQGCQRLESPPPSPVDSHQLMTCLICEEGSNENLLLLCDNCDRGYHTYCLSPPLLEVPPGDWFCPDCTSAQQGGLPWVSRIRSHLQEWEEDSLSEGQSENPNLTPHPNQINDNSSEDEINVRYGESEEASGYEESPSSSPELKQVRCHARRNRRNIIESSPEASRSDPEASRSDSESSRTGLAARGRTPCDIRRYHTQKLKRRRVVLSPEITSATSYATSPTTSPATCWRATGLRKKRRVITETPESELRHNLDNGILDSSTRTLDMKSLEVYRSGGFELKGKKEL
ncbi:hypothetical protein AAMO2058_000187400 [Amorphochlora amoebiformis]